MLPVNFRLLAACPAARVIEGPIRAPSMGARDLGSRTDRRPPEWWTKLAAGDGSLNLDTWVVPALVGVRGGPDYADRGLDFRVDGSLNTLMALIAVRTRRVLLLGPPGRRILRGGHGGGADATPSGGAPYVCPT